MADKKRRAPVPPSYLNGTQSGGRELSNPAYVEPEPQLQTPRMSLPLPDYETLFPQKRHGVQGQTRWDHIVAEVNQKHRDDHIELTGKEMSVDGPAERRQSSLYDRKDSSSPVRQYEAPKPVSSKSVPAPDPPKKVAPPQYRSQFETSEVPSKNSSQTRSSVVGPDSLQKPAPSDRSSGGSGSFRKILHPSSTEQAPTPKSGMEKDRSPQGSLRVSQTTNNREAPTAKPRQKPRDSVLISEDTQFNVNIIENKAPETESDPFPDKHLLSKDTKTRQFHDVDLFTGNNDKKPEEQGMTADELDKIFSSDKTSDTLIVSNDSSSQEEYRSHTKSQNYHDKEEPFTANRFTPEALPVVLEEPAAGGLAGGKPSIRAWVSPSEVQPVSAQSGIGGGLALSQRRPHPVKPLNPADGHQPSSTPAFKEIKVQDSAPSKHKVSGSSESGPYTQLTQEELITLVVKQQVDLSKRDAKIVELEEYIDNLLVRVIEENPSILQSLDAKPN